MIIKKMEYYREGGSEKHLRDITGILKVSAEQVDRTYIADRAERLDLNEIWSALARRVPPEVAAGPAEAPSRLDKPR